MLSEGDRIKVKERTLKDIFSKLTSRGIFRTYPRGSVLWLKGEPNDLGLLIIETGIVKIVDYTPEGKEITLRFLGPGELLGDISCLTGLPHSLTAEAYTNVRCLIIPKREVNRTLESQPELWRDIALISLKRLYNLTESYITLIRDDTETRLRELLSSLENLNLKLTHSELASMLGVSRETVSRLLKRIKRKL